jgi:hypothetical protein
MQQGTRDMLIAHEGEEIVCPKGTVCGSHHARRQQPNH